MEPQRKNASRAKKSGAVAPRRKIEWVVIEFETTPPMQMGRRKDFFKCSAKEDLPLICKMKINFKKRFMILGKERNADVIA